MHNINYKKVSNFTVLIDSCVANCNGFQVQGGPSKRIELEGAQKARLAPAEVDEDDKEINPHIPQYMSSAPSYLNAERPAAEVLRRLSKLRDTFVSAENFMRLQNAETRLKELKSALKALGREATAFMLSFEEQKQKRKVREPSHNNPMGAKAHYVIIRNINANVIVDAIGASNGFHGNLVDEGEWQARRFSSLLSPFTGAATATASPLSRHPVFFSSRHPLLPRRDSGAAAGLPPTSLCDSVSVSIFFFADLSSSLFFVVIVIVVVVVSDCWGCRYSGDCCCGDGGVGGCAVGDGGRLRMISCVLFER
ncbi:hypothetical protein PIB30_018687 [Stylosanthes scabra]|uniref:Pre-mRNA-splicing factor SLU7 n=1 Tax=Stylosanthes scabra TaxID=79078 RepID=A0ABU6W6H2_9FABA|nr:hypothetical protein [Stylosanthes scabra]